MSMILSSKVSTGRFLTCVAIGCLGMTLLACQVPATPQLPPMTTSSSAPVAATSTPVYRPDDDGLYVSPGPALTGSAVYLPLEAGPAGAFLAEVQERLRMRDETWLTESIGDGDTVNRTQGTLWFHAIGEDEPIGSLREHEVAGLLTELFAAGSRPILQGYFASRGETPVFVSFDEPQTLAGLDTVDVVTTGWQGESASFGDDFDSAPQAASWRFERSGTTWHWSSWSWSSPDEYSATVAATERHLMASRESRYSIYHVVRPENRWPTPDIAQTRDVPSPDGQWVAREISGNSQEIDPREPDTKLAYVGIELVHEPTDRRWQMNEHWQSGDIGSTTPSVFAWLPDGGTVILDNVICGDGCVSHCSHTLSAFDTETQSPRLLPYVGSDPTLDPTGQFIAGLGSGDTDARNELVVSVLDLATMKVVSAPFFGEEFGFLAWAPDGSALVFTIADQYEMCAEFPASHLVRFDIETAQLTALTTVDERFRRVSAWQPEGVLEVMVFDGGAIWVDRDADAIEYRSAATGEIVESYSPIATATPGP